MTENEIRAKVVSAARAWLNRNEADGSFRPIIDRYNAINPLPRGYRMTYSDAWCAAFVSAVGAACGLTDIIFPECACDPMIAAYMAAGRWVEDDDYHAKPGDLIFYDWQDSGAGDCTGSSDHVGLIVADNEHYFTVVEGNYSDAVKERTLAHNSRYIRGFAVPDYEAAAGTTWDSVVHDGTNVGQAAENVGQTGQKTEQTSVFDFVALPILRYGDGLDDPREDVRAAQFLLIGRGFRCGSAGADGEFGEQTRKAVEQMQRGYNLAVDGVIGAKTWGALLGVRA